MCPTWTQPFMHLNHCDTTLRLLFKTEIFMIIFSALFSGFSPFPLPKRPSSTFSFLLFFILFFKSLLLIQFNYRNTKERGARTCFDHVTTLARTLPIPWLILVQWCLLRLKCWQPEMINPIDWVTCRKKFYITSWIGCLSQMPQGQACCRDIGDTSGCRTQIWCSINLGARRSWKEEDPNMNFSTLLTRFYCNTLETL